MIYTVLFVSKSFFIFYLNIIDDNQNTNSEKVHQYDMIMISTNNMKSRINKPSYKKGGDILKRYPQIRIITHSKDYICFDFSSVFPISSHEIYNMVSM